MHEIKRYFVSGISFFIPVLLFSLPLAGPGFAASPAAHADRPLLRMAGLPPGLAPPLPATPEPGTLRAIEFCLSGNSYSADSKDIPPIIAAAFKGQSPSLVFRVCTDIDKNTHYFLRPPPENQDGICRVTEQEIYPEASSEAVIEAPGTNIRVRGFSRTMPDAWREAGYPETIARVPVALAQVAHGSCPPGNDPHYFDVFKVSPALIKSLDRAFNRALASGVSFTNVYNPPPGGPAPSAGASHVSAPPQGPNFRSVTCTPTTCSVVLSNRSRVDFDIHGDDVVITHVEPGRAGGR